MGVHQSPEVYSKIKELLGIPEDEPIFIFRAQDKYAPSTIKTYKYLAVGDMKLDSDTKKWIENLDSDINDFLNWQRDNREKVKVPD